MGIGGSIVGNGAVGRFYAAQGNLPSTNATPPTSGSEGLTRVLRGRARLYVASTERSLAVGWGSMLIQKSGLA